MDLLDVDSKHEQKKHVAEDMRPPRVHEHRGEEGEPERRRCSRDERALMRVLAWHQRIRVDEIVDLRTLCSQCQLVEEDQEVDDDDPDGRDRNRGGRVIGVI
jgi:hypothetical protein